MPRIAYRRPVKTAVAYFEEKLRYEISPSDLKERMDHKHDDFQVIDVRTLEAYKAGHVPGALSIPFTELRERLSDISEDKENIIYCYSITCTLAYEAARFLAERGYQAKVLIGGFEEWQRSMLRVSTL